jgi:hypothetical protein
VVILPEGDAIGLDAEALFERQDREAVGRTGESQALAARTSQFGSRLQRGMGFSAGDPRFWRYPLLYH